MSIWLTYRHWQVDDLKLFGGFEPQGIEDLDIVKFGALINF